MVLCIVIIAIIFELPHVFGILKQAARMTRRLYYRYRQGIVKLSVVIHSSVNQDQVNVDECSLSQV